MARKIQVVPAHSDQPSEPHLKKSIAQNLVRRHLAEWVIKNVRIKMRAIREIPVTALKSGRGAYDINNYIPERLPPAELPGVIFVPPAKVPDYSFLERLRSAHV
jgi:hypothetical protein